MTTNIMDIGDLWDRVGEIVRYLKEQEATNRTMADPANIGMLGNFRKSALDHIQKSHSERAAKEAIWIEAWSRVLDGGTATPDELMPAAVDFRKDVALCDSAAPQEGMWRRTAAFFGLSLAPRVEEGLQSFHARAKERAQMSDTAQEVIRLFGGGDVPVEDAERVFDHSCTQCGLSELDWIYKVKDDVCADVGMVARELCYSCIQARLGRRMTLDDLVPHSREQLKRTCEGTYI